MVPPKDKRSLREIQEEEHALQAEADFLKWWTAEEERVQQEALALEEFQSNLQKPAQRSSSPRKSLRNPKHNNKDKKDKGESAGAGFAQASTMPQRVPSTAGESSGASGRQQPPTAHQPGNESRANHSPRKQSRKPRPKGSADS